MSDFGNFPFGQPILPVYQADRSKKDVFVLGVYASAVHAKWIDNKGNLRIKALAVASEPEIFWKGDSAGEIIKAIDIPAGAGRLESAGEKFNGPSGKSLDEDFLSPLGVSRNDAWLCDLVPHSCMNPAQNKALEERYLPYMKDLGLPEPKWPTLPNMLADEKRQSEIEAEIKESSAGILITLGDQPLRWFASRYGAYDRLQKYGDTKGSYGQLHQIRIAGRDMQLLPLVHPRQARKLGSHSATWSALHEYWKESLAPMVLAAHKGQ